MIMSRNLSLFPHSSTAVGYFRSCYFFAARRIGAPSGNIKGAITLANGKTKRAAASAAARGASKRAREKGAAAGGGGGGQEGAGGEKVERAVHVA